MAHTYKKEMVVVVVRLLSLGDIADIASKDLCSSPNISTHFKRTSPVVSVSLERALGKLEIH